MTQTSGFFAKSDRGSILMLEELFYDSDKYVFFIEDPVTHNWLTVEQDWTNDPLKAFKFKSEMKARTYAITLHLSNYIITEHEFIK